MTTIFDILKRNQELQNKKILRYFKIFLVLFTLYILGFGFFIFKTKQIPIASNDTTDAIVVLTGASGRIAEGIKQLTKNKADKLFISGVYKKNPNNNIIKNIISKLNKTTNSPIPSDILSRIEEGKAKNTIGNAIETKIYVEENKIQSIRLMTSFYHIPRVKILFSKYLPSTNIIYHPIYTKKEKNLLKHNNFAIIFIEYNKYLITILWDKLNISTKTTLKILGAV